MTPKQFVDRQLQLPAYARVIPDRLYMWTNHANDLTMLSRGKSPFNANDVFMPAVYYENAEYFGPNGPGRHKYYSNGVFEP